MPEKMRIQPIQVFLMVILSTSSREDASSVAGSCHIAPLFWPRSSRTRGLALHRRTSVLPGAAFVHACFLRSPWSVGDRPLWARLDPFDSHHIPLCKELKEMFERTERVPIKP